MLAIQKNFRLYLLLFVAPLLLCCSKSSKYKSGQQDIDPSAPGKIRQVIAKYSGCGSCPPVIYQYEWNGEIYYGETCGGPACDCVVILYDKNGDRIQLADAGAYTKFIGESKIVKTVWRCKE